MGLADLHIHTLYSHDGTATPAAVLKYAAHHSDLDVIAITDHDQIRGALEAQEMAFKYAIEVVPGIEVTSAEGHVLALWMQKEIPAGLSLAQTLGRIGEQGGLAIAPHPMHPAAHGLSAASILAASQDPDLAKVLIGVEVFNAGLIIQRGSNRQAQRLADTLPLAQTGSSDAHTPFMLGAGRTRFTGNSAKDLRSALQQAGTQPIAARNVPGIFILLDWLWLYAMRAAGLPLHNLAPEANLGFRRQTA